MFFRVACSEGGQDAQVYKGLKCLKTLVFSANRCQHAAKGGRQKGEATHIIFRSFFDILLLVFSHFLVTLFLSLVLFLPIPFCLPPKGLLRHNDVVPLKGFTCIWANRRRFVVFPVLCLLAYGDTALKT